MIAGLMLVPLIVPGFLSNPATFMTTAHYAAFHLPQVTTHQLAVIIRAHSRFGLAPM